MKIQCIILIAALSNGFIFANEVQVPTEQRNQIEKAIVEASRSILPQKNKVEAVEIELQKEKRALTQMEEALDAEMEKLKAWHVNNNNATNSSLEVKPAIKEHVLTIRATGSVYVLVKNSITNQEMLRKTLVENQSVTLKPKNGVDILFTAGENLMIEWDGEEMKPDTGGTAKMSLK